MNDPFNVVDLFYDTARQIPDKDAIIYKTNNVSFGELEKSVSDTAHFFLAKGISKGDRVMVFVPMSDDLYRVVLALFRIGAVAVFLDEWVNIKRLNDCCRLAECKAFIGTPKGRILAWLIPGLRQIPLHLGLRITLSERALTFPETNQEDIALITFTTGSTGVPKAAIRTHGLLYEQFQALIPLIKPDREEICMPTLPIVLLINLGAGVTSVIADYNMRKPDSMHPEKIIAQFNKYRVTTVISSPFFIKKLSRYLIANPSHAARIKKIFTGGAPVFPAEAAIYRNAFPDTDIQIVFGSTEAEPISSVPVQSLIENEKGMLLSGLFVGKTEPCISLKTIKITDQPIAVSTLEELAQLETKQGEIGEIIVAGKHVLRDYFHNREAQQRNKIFIGDECWHRTGDSGFVDVRGNVFLTGRCNSLIHLPRQTLSPFVYENHFQSIEGVETGTIMYWNKKIIAVIETKSGAARTDIQAKISALPHIADQVLFLKKIPRDPRHYSKVDYEKLKSIVKHKL